MLTVIYWEVTDHILMEHAQELYKTTPGILDLRELEDCRRMKDPEDLTVQGTTRIVDMEINRPESLRSILVNERPLHFGLAPA